MKDDVEEVVVDEEGNVIEAAVIERVKPVLEILEDEGVADDDDDDDDEVVEDDDEDSDDDSEDENED
jgi:DNA gyrase subunit A